jgi:hypothetical protein
MQIGQFASAKNYSKVAPGVYDGVVVKCEVVMDPDKPEAPLVDKYGKKRLLVEIVLDNVRDDAGGPITLARRLPISYGKNNSTGTHAALAVLIEAAMDVRAGNPAQGHVTTEQLEGKRLQVLTKNVTKDDKTYSNIVDFLAPKKAPAVPPQFVHQPRPAEVGTTDDPADGDDSWPDAP